jgi:multiple sugar transport system substrate-binding protein
MMKSVSRREFLRISAGFAAGTFLVACQPTTGPAVEGGEADQATTQVMFWPRGANDEMVLTSMLPMAKELYPEIEIVFDTPPEGIYDKLAVSIAGGTAPDSTVINTPWGVPMIGQGAFLSLQDYIEADAAISESFAEHYARPSVAAYSLDGASYTVPMTSESIVMWYNLDAIEEAGLVAPREIEDDPDAWNWTTLVEYADALNIGTGRDRERFGIICSGYRDAYGLQTGFGNFVYSNGGSFMSEDGKSCTFDSPENAEALQFVYDFIYTHDTHPEITSLLDSQSVRTVFLNQQSGLLLEGEFLRRYLWGAQAPSEGISFRYDLAKMPFINGERAMVYHCLGAPILKDSANPDATWKWLSVIGSLEAQQLITDTWGSRGSDTRTYASWLEADGHGGPDGINVAAITNSDEFGVPFPVSPYMQTSELLEPITRVIYELVLQNSMPVGEGLTEVQREISERLERSMREMGIS